MQAVICAAGRGSRVAHLTEKYPKALLPVGDKRVIEHILEALVVSGITKVVIIVGYKKEAVMSYLGSEYRGCVIIYVENDHFDVSDNLYSMFLAREYITDGMLFVNGDTIFHADILKNFLTFASENAVVVDKVNTEDHPVFAHIRNEAVVEIGHDIEKKSHGSVFGIYKLSQSASERYFSVAEEVFISGPKRGGFFMPLNTLATEFKIKPFFSDDPRWVNINTEYDYEKAKNIFMIT